MSERALVGVREAIEDYVARRPARETPYEAWKDVIGIAPGLPPGPLGTHRREGAEVAPGTPEAPVVILVDAGPLVALLSADDQHRADCVRALKGIRGPLATVWPAVTEAMHLLSPRPQAQDALWGQLQEEILGLLPLDSRDSPRIKELTQKYRDRPMDLADAALVRVAEREGVRTIFTVDRADFEIYRLFGRTRFRIIP